MENTSLSSRLDDSLHTPGYQQTAAYQQVSAGASPNAHDSPDSQDSITWQPSLFLKLSAVLHAFVLLAVVIVPSTWPWALAAVVINHAGIVIAGLLPRCNWLGPNWTKLPAAAAARNEIALTIDDGPNPAVTPQVLDILDRYQVKATFFCIGEKALRYPELCREIVRRGHAVENHSQHHFLHFSLFGTSNIQKEIVAAQTTLAGITGQSPLFFRAPAGLRNLFLDIVLNRLQMRLASWSVRAFDTKVGNPSTVQKTLLARLQPGCILLLHDDNSAETASGVPVILEVLPGLLENAAKAGLQFVTLRNASL